MITTCDKCRWGKDQGRINNANDKHFGERFFYCEGTRKLIRERSALDQEVTCPNFLPRNASCKNCEYIDTCTRKDHIGNDVCYEWSLI